MTGRPPSATDRLREHRGIWSAKPVLRTVYAAWFDRILEKLATGARVLEVGAGPGFFKEYAHLRRPDLRWLASDLTAVPWNDIVADAGRLPFRTASIDALVGLDTLHHLPEPRLFLAEAARVLRVDGPLVLVEPWVTPFSYPIYKWLHQEDCDTTADPWTPFARGSSKDAFDGNAALPGLVTKALDASGWNAAGLRPPAVTLINAFAYLLTLGFRPGSLLPLVLARPLLAFDRATASLRRLTALRAEIVWRRV